MNIGFFDSGLGGVAVLKKALDMGLSENIYYLGDTKNTPYGTKEENFVKEVINDNIDYLVSLDCNPIVIACNTATSLCVNELREKGQCICNIYDGGFGGTSDDWSDKKRELYSKKNVMKRPEQRNRMKCANPMSN